MDSVNTGSHCKGVHSNHFSCNYKNDRILLLFPSRMKSDYIYFYANTVWFNNIKIKYLPINFLCALEDYDLFFVSCPNFSFV